MNRRPKALLAGYKKNKKSAIAPDALLLLGMSLAQLGEKDAACSTLGAIAKQFPDAPDKLKQDVASVQKRTPMLRVRPARPIPVS